MSGRFDDHEHQITLALQAIKSLMAPPAPSRRQIGFAPAADE
jgi:hypothetical protein